MKFTRMGLFLVSGLLVASCAAAPTSQLGGSSSGKSVLDQATANDRFALMSQEPVCIPCVFDTATRGGWAQDAEGNNVGTLRDALFATGFSTQIGFGANILTFDDSQDVIDFLTSGVANGDSGPLPTPGTFGAQVLSLTLNIAVNPGLDQVTIVGYDPDGDNTDNTIAEFLADANTALGGGGLPTGYTFSALNDIAASINQFFQAGGIETDGTTFQCPDGGVQVPNS